MSDDADRAGDIEELMYEAFKRTRKTVTGVSAKECVECGEEIPEGRRKVLPGVKLCVECAE